MPGRFALLWISAVLAAMGDASADTVDPLPKLIVNLSADSMFECLAIDGPLNASTPKEELLMGYRNLVDRYVDTNVSHLFFNINFQRVAYDSKVCETYWDCPNPETDTDGWPLDSINICLDFITFNPKAQTCTLPSPACKRKGNLV